MPSVATKSEIWDQMQGTPLNIFTFPLLGLLFQDSVYRREFISGLSE
jgi:hypothetical protein